MPTKLFVGGIPYRTTDEELRQLFSQAGEVSVFIPMDRETAPGLRSLRWWMTRRQSDFNVGRFRT
jgi:RNA recognition motif-containing protein